MHSVLYVIGTCALILFGGIYFALNSEQRTKLRDELTIQDETRTKLDLAMKQQKKSIEEIEASNRVLQRRYDEMSLQNAECAKVRTQLEEQKTAQNGMLESLANIQKAHREKAVGQKFGTLLLNNGQKLENVVFKEVKPEAVSLFHSEGFLKVPAENAPEELVERFGLQPGEGPSSADQAAELAYQSALAMAGEKLKNGLKTTVKEKTVEKLKLEQERLEDVHRSAMNRYLRRRAVAWRAWTAYSECRSPKDKPQFEATARMFDAEAAQLANEVAKIGVKLKANHDLIYTREHP